jgi:hypothetical protein
MVLSMFSQIIQSMFRTWQHGIVTHKHTSHSSNRQRREIILYIMKVTLFEFFFDINIIPQTPKLVSLHCTIEINKSKNPNKMHVFNAGE